MIPAARMKCNLEIHVQHGVDFPRNFRYIEQLQRCLNSSCGLACVMLLGDKIGPLTMKNESSQKQQLHRSASAVSG
jgi:hypothetical protein